MSTQQDVWTKLEKFRDCMLVTQDAEGMRARPMSPIFRAEAGEIWFLSGADGMKDDEIHQSNDVCLTFSSNGLHVSLSGQGSVTRDRKTIEDLWNPGAQAFFPNGPSDPDVVAIRVAPTKAEVWDGPGAVVGMVKMATAYVTGSQPDMGENTKVRF